jgi:putative ABC transport system ATP-binding protein
MTSLIQLKNVWKIYHLGEVEVQAVRNISVSIQKGDYVVILGPSGSGKSTMMNLVGALDTPSKGKIILDKKDISEMTESELAQLRGKRIGFVFQQFNLIPTLTATQNVELPMMFYNVPTAQRLKRARDLLIKVGLSHRLNHLPSKLSGGEQQRVAIARALANDPEMVLADEPTGNLDTKTGQQIMQLLADLHEEGKTIVMVTHDTDLVKYAHHIVELKDGQVLKERTIKKEVRRHEKNHH